MHDLIGAYERVNRLYQLYIKSAFPLRSQVLSDERDNLLRQPEVLSQPPLLETVPVYSPAGVNLSSATAGLPTEFAGLAPLAQKLFPSNRELYQHQWDSLREVLANHKDLVVTTGTGSGKTECFLLPLLGQLARESATWEKAGSPPPNRQWWHSSDSSRDSDNLRVSQWAHISRPKALRAIILYPLNALVEDQLRRLRMALDDDTVHRWLDQQRGGNRITFGRYTGLTPISGKETDQSRQRLRKELIEIEQQRQKILETQGFSPLKKRASRSGRHSSQSCGAVSGSKEECRFSRVCFSKS